MENISDNILTLTVPVDRELREEIRQKTDDYFVTNVTTPPVSYNRLAEFADILIALHDWNKNYKAFAMICCGNAIWRSVVGAIPYERRMLLLPQCLKNSKMCRAQEDEFGLLCNECGNCSISRFIQEAEKLGYITIVAEGTTIATKLAKSGKVDAIIGVSCMEALQKTFLAVNKYSVPVIGVPLLSCGCIDTKADADWIMDEIHYSYHHNGFSLINLNDLKEKTDLLFTPENINTLLGLNNTPADEIVREILLAGGKRIRPLLTALSYLAYSKEPDTGILQNLAMSVECFHKASLVHDDIEDGDEQRYGKATIHQKHGVPVAINTGDLLIGEGYRLVTECKFEPHIMQECLKVVVQGHKAMTLGQGFELLSRKNNEILTLNEILTIFENKTASAFRVSLLTGAIAGKADYESVRLLDRFSSLIGTAYQIKDDLEDITETSDCSALRNPSVVVSVLAEKAGKENIDAIRQAVIDNDSKMLKNLTDQYSIADMTEKIIGEYLQDTDACLAGLRNVSLKLALHEIIGKTFSKYL